MTTTITVVAPISVEITHMGYKDWWLPCGCSPSDCIVSYRAKGASSLAASYVNLANLGTYDLTGATPTWNTLIGWTSYVNFTEMDILTLPMTFAWRGKLSDGACPGVVASSAIFAGLYGKCDSGNLFIGMNLDLTPIFIIPIADFSLQYTIVYQKLANQSQNLWIDGVIQSGSPKAGTTPTGYKFKLYTGDNKCESVAVYNVALSNKQVVDLTASMGAL